MSGWHNNRDPQSMRIAGAVLLALAGCALDGVVLAAAPANAPSDASPRASLAVDVPAAERQFHKVVEDAVSAPKNIGAWHLLANRQIQYLRRDQALLQALNKNLALRVRKAESEKVRDAIQEAQAVFDPQLNLGVGRRKNQTYERTINGTIVERKFTPKSPLDIVVPQDANDPQVATIGFRTRQESETVTKDIEVSQRQINGPEESTEYNVNLDQLTPWGTRIALGVMTVDKDVYYNVAKKRYSYNASWSSNMLLNLDTPLPGGAGFGNYGPAAIQQALRRKEFESAHWDVRAALDAISAEVDAGYWRLVAMLERIALADGNVELVREQVQRTQRLLQSGKATNYDSALIEAELARASAEQEEARQLYFAASQTLGLLVEDEASAADRFIYLPYGYSRLLAAANLPSREAALANALQQRPDVHLQALAKDTAQLTQFAAGNQARPNINFSAAMNLMQDGSVYGYKSMTDSVSHLLDPDSRTQEYGVSYRYPLFNRAARARVTGATAGAEDTALQGQLLQLRVRQEIDMGFDLVQLADSRLKFSQEMANFSETAFDRLRKRRDIGADVNENELLETLRNLHTARSAVAAARIARKQAETGLYQAMGMLQQMHVSDAASNDFERMRLAALQHTGRLYYFTPLLPVLAGSASP